MEATAGSAIDTRHLRSALEFAMAMVREGQKLKPPLRYPAALKKYLKLPRLTATALPGVRRAIEVDDEFRTALGVGALEELVDPIGRLWLQRPEGWEAEAIRLAGEADAAAEAAEAAAELRRSEKRREAAEQATARVTAELVVLRSRLSERDSVIDGLRSDVVKLAELVDELRTELVDTRNEARHARDREAAAVAKLDAALAAREAAVAEKGSAERIRDDVLADRAALAAERSELARLAAMAGSLAEQLVSLSAPSPANRAERARRTPLSVPGGLLGSSSEVTEFFLRSGASVIVDGYNVSKQAWPDLDLAGQRIVLLDAVENVARRYGCDITVVFDGAGVVGATADRRRIVRVVFSPDDVIADDVIRDEVRRLPVTRAVVVVTNDQQIVRDVRGMGANTVNSEQLIALMR
jgi:predicted RNA-binding protein with PIN domain